MSLKITNKESNMNSTLQTMKQDLTDYYKLLSCSKKFQHVAQQNDIDKMLFIAYLQEQTNKSFLKWISEKTYLIKDLQVLSDNAETIEIKKEKGIVKVKIEISYNNSQLGFRTINIAVSSLIDFIQQTHKGFIVYYENCDEDIDTQTVKFQIALCKKR